MIDFNEVLSSYKNIFTTPNASKYIIVVNGNQINKAQRFVVRRTIENFVDSFEMQLSNIRNGVSPLIYLGDKVQFIKTTNNEAPTQEVIFEGLVERKETSSNNVDMTLRISGRDTIVDLVESTAQFATFKKTTDNAIIQKVVEQAGLGYELQLGTASPVSEYTIGPGDSIAAVIDGVAKLNNFFVWKKGNTIIKERIATGGAPVYHYFISGGELVDSSQSPPPFGSNVLQYASEEDITQAKTSVLGYSQSAGKAKANLKASKEIEIYKSSAYQLMLRDGNRHIGSSSRINRPYSMSVSGKTLAEMQKEIDVAAKRCEPLVKITLTVKGFQGFELNDIISLTHEGEGINKNFVLTGIVYTLDEYNREVSELTLRSLGAYPY